MPKIKKAFAALSTIIPLAVKFLAPLYIRQVTPSKKEIKKTMILFTIVILALLVFAITNWEEIMG